MRLTDAQVHWVKLTTGVLALLTAVHGEQKYWPLLMEIAEPAAQPHLLADQTRDPKQAHFRPSDPGPLEYIVESQVTQTVLVALVTAMAFWPLQMHPILAAHTLLLLQRQVVGDNLFPAVDLVAEPQAGQVRVSLMLNMTVVVRVQIQ
jgi:hypothetical protein